MLSSGVFRFHAERLRSLQVDDELLAAVAFDGQITRLRSLQDTIDIGGGARGAPGNSRIDLKQRPGIAGKSFAHRERQLLLQGEVGGSDIVCLSLLVALYDFTSAQKMPWSSPDQQPSAR